MDKKTRTPPQNPATPDPTSLRDVLISAMAHDLRSPLGAVSIFCEILMMGKDKLDEQQQQNLAMIAEATNKAQRIIDDGAEVCRIYQGQLTLLSESTPLPALVSDGISGNDSLAEKRRVTVSSQIPPGSTVYCDPNATRALLLRIVEEAIHHTPTEGTLVIGTTSASETLILHMETNGLPPNLNRPRAESVKGRLGNRDKNESPYSIVACQYLMHLMGGAVAITTDDVFRAELRFRTAPQ